MDPRRLGKTTYGLEYTSNPQLEVLDYVSNIGKPSTVLKIGCQLRASLQSQLYCCPGKADAARKQ